MQDNVLVREQIVGKPMILTGATCMIVKGDRCASSINTQPNSSGEFRAVDNTEALRKMAKEEVQILLKHFPAEA